MAAEAAISARVGEFYERHPYPPPKDDLAEYRRMWDERRRRAESFLFWPGESYREDRSILVAGCGTVQAAHYAVRWPRARVVGIDASEAGIEFTQQLKHKHGLKNLELRRLVVERAVELQERFDHVVCTGVLHHLPDPDAGLCALREVLEVGGAMHVMVYAPYGRTGVYIIQDYCRRLGIGATPSEIRELATTLQSLPADHPIAPLLRSSRDFSNEAGLADALLHPNDRAYSVPQLMDFLARGGLRFGRWIRQAPYLASCGAIATTPHARILARMSQAEQYAALELFRGTMVRHSAVVYRTDDRAHPERIDFSGEEWRGHIPIRLPDTIAVRDRVPEGAAAVLINRNHTYTDLYLPITPRQDQLLAAIDGKRTVGEICANKDFEPARTFFEQLWFWDQIVFDTSFDRLILRQAHPSTGSG
ncbi:MAG: class I SAM-dependent methyltransferase [Candidatus Eremiobacteraeota bacterium]|nr:class I SAM-dependent methyltransferase [Candidatus Eremiobacteraeota bacterium]